MESPAEVIDVSFDLGPPTLGVTCLGEEAHVKCQVGEGDRQQILLPGHSQAKSCVKKPPVFFLFETPIARKHLLPALECLALSWVQCGHIGDLSVIFALSVEGSREQDMD